MDREGPGQGHWIFVDAVRRMARSIADTCRAADADTSILASVPSTMDRFTAPCVYMEWLQGVRLELMSKAPGQPGQIEAGVDAKLQECEVAIRMVGVMYPVYCIISANMDTLPLRQIVSNYTMTLIAHDSLARARAENGSSLPPFDPPQEMPPLTAAAGMSARYNYSSVLPADEDECADCALTDDSGDRSMSQFSVLCKGVFEATVGAVSPPPDQAAGSKRLLEGAEEAEDAEGAEGAEGARKRSCADHHPPAAAEAPAEGAVDAPLSRAVVFPVSEYDERSSMRVRASRLFFELGWMRVDDSGTISADLDRLNGPGFRENVMRIARARGLYSVERVMRAASFVRASIKGASEAGCALSSLHFLGWVNS